MESEFFGYESGAFTGAQKGGRAGYFEMSDHGTLFLDEVSELPLVLQSKLLRVLESGEFMRLGGHVAHKVDVRIISATNRDLREMVEMGKFRQDLFYRLNVIPITMPPLRERPEDILALADLYLQQCNRKFGLNQYFSQETRALFLNYDWPGNVRELKNVVQRLAVTIKQDELLLDRDTFFRPIVVPLKDTEGDKGIAETALPWKAYMERAEVEYFRQMLLHCKGNVSCAAKEMGLHRSALYKKIRKYGLTGFAQREE